MGIRIAGRGSFAGLSAVASPPSFVTCICQNSTCTWSPSLNDVTLARSLAKKKGLDCCPGTSKSTWVTVPSPLTCATIAVVEYRQFLPAITSANVEHAGAEAYAVRRSLRLAKEKAATEAARRPRPSASHKRVSAAAPRPFLHRTAVAAIPIWSLRLLDSTAAANRNCRFGSRRVCQHLMRDAISSRIMRTTLDLDSTVLKELRQRSQESGKSMGQLASELLARSLSDDGVRPRPARRLTWTSKPLGRPLVDLEDKEAVRAAIDSKP